MTERDAFFARCFEVVSRAARAYTRYCSCDAEDLGQDVMELVLKKPARFQRRPSSYLWVTARNVHADRHRRGAGRFRWVSVDGDRPPRLVVPPDQAAQAGFLRAIAKLGGRDREMLALDLGTAVSSAEAAERLRITRDAYYQRTSRARRRLLELAGLKEA
jgi:RNA polymerase sigma factor (sigma-70 family)